MTAHPARQVIASALALVAFASTARAEGTGSIEGTISATPAKYLPDTVVYLESVPGTYPHRTVDINQQGMEFLPHIVTITAGDTVRFLNQDPLDHNVSSPDCHYDLGTWGKGGEHSHKFDKPGVCTQLCKVHPEMRAYVFVGQNPYAAVVSKDGHYTITGVPPGTYALRVWNAHLRGEGQTVTVTADHVTRADRTVHR